MDFILQTDLGVLPQAIEFNYSELKADIAKRLEHYKNLVVDENGIKQAKEDKARLNKLITAIEEQRKEVKRRCLEPYNDFEAKCKDLVCLIKTPVVAIDTQIKQFDEMRRQEKYDELLYCFEEHIGDMAEIIQFEKILNPKWGNVTAKTDTLKAEIEDTIDRIREELKTLDNQYSDKPYKAAVIAEYCKDYNMSRTIVYASQLDYEAKMQAKVLPKKTERPAEAVPEKAVTTEVIPEEPKGSCSFKVTCTRSQLIALREFMKSNAIEFEVIR